MKVIILFALIAVSMAANDIEFYTHLIDDLDPEALIKDTVRFQEYLECFKGVKPCSEVANLYKADIPESLAQACRRCSPARKLLARRFIEELKAKQPQEFEMLKSIVDPENKYFDAFYKAITEN